MLKGLVLYAKRLVGNVGYDGKNLAVFPQADSKYWQATKKIDYVRPKQPTIKVPGLVLKEGADPAKAYGEFLTAGKKAVLDCATFQVVCTRLALLEVLGLEKFRKTFGGNVPLAGMYGQPHPFPRETGVGRPITGDYVEISYPPGTDDVGDLLNENCIIVRADPKNPIVIGHPFTTAMTVTAMITEIQRKTNVNGTKLNPDGFQIHYRDLP